MESESCQESERRIDAGLSQEGSQDANCRRISTSSGRQRGCDSAIFYQCFILGHECIKDYLKGAVALFRRRRCVQVHQSSSKLGEKQRSL